MVLPDEIAVAASEVKVENSCHLDEERGEICFSFIENPNLLPQSYTKPKNKIESLLH